MGMKFSILCCCANSFGTNLSPFYPNSFKPVYVFIVLLKPFQSYVHQFFMMALE